MKSRNSSLDVLRGIAVLMVLVSHYPLRGWMLAGWFGVDLFFVLSGFLISGLLFADLQQIGKIRIGRFLSRRGFKIYPAFYFFLLTTCALWPVVRPYSPPTALFLQNYLVPHTPFRGWAHLWSLAVEEHFYLALPFILAALNRYRKLNAVPAVALGIALFCFIYRATCCVDFATVMYQSQCRADALFIGVALGYLRRFNPERFIAISSSPALRLWPVLLLPAFFAPHIPLPAPYLSGVLTLNAVAFAMILCSALSRGMHFAPLEFIGKHSYSIYLWHTVVLVYFLRWPVTASTFAAYLLLAIFLGCSMAYLIEIPFLRLRDRISPPLISLSSPVATGQSA